MIDEKGPMIQATRGVLPEEIEWFESFGGSTVVMIGIGGIGMHLTVRTVDLAPVIFAGWRKDNGRRVSTSYLPAVKDRIRTLRTEAGAAGDLAQVALCDRALTGADEEALTACVDALTDTEAQG